MSFHEADPVRAIVIAAMVIVLMVVLVVELRVLRSRRARRAERGDLPDRAHNAILTSKAIADTLAHGGVRSEQADELIREAEGALRMRNYRVAIELSDKAKSVLRSAKQRYEARGDLTKLDSIASKATADEEVTTKERLMKELPQNYMQSKFTINLAREEIDAAKAAGRDVRGAEGHFAEGQASFDAQDYEAALRHAIRARRALEVPTEESASAAPVVTPPPAPNVTKAHMCPSCGASVAVDDAFCRTCGVKMPMKRTCPSCGADVAEDDAFCRKCGTKFG